MLFSNFQSGKNAPLPLLFLGIIFFLSGCGYTNPYSQPSELVDEGGEQVSIYVSMWENRTSELGYQSVLQQTLVRWLKKSRRFSLTNNRAEADYILSGIIESAEYPGLSYGLWERAVELRAEITFSFNLKENDTGKIVLQKRDFTRREAFRVGSNASDMEMNKKEALRELADDIADNIYIQLFYKFSRDDLKDVQEEIFPEDEIDIDD